jgi:hypothetical protein
MIAEVGVPARHSTSYPVPIEGGFGPACQSVER